jgi:hypothetical protein
MDRSTADLQWCGGFAEYHRLQITTVKIEGREWFRARTPSSPARLRAADRHG